MMVVWLLCWAAESAVVGAVRGAGVEIWGGRKWFAVESPLSGCGK